MAALRNWRRVCLAFGLIALGCCIGAGAFYLRFGLRDPVDQRLTKQKETDRPVENTDQHDMSIQAFRVLENRQPTTFTGKCRLSFFFPFATKYRKETHIAIDLDADGTNLFAYAPRDSEIAAKLFQVLHDGKTHKMTITVQQVGDESQYVEVVAVR